MLIRSSSAHPLLIQLVLTFVVCHENFQLGAAISGLLALMTLHPLLGTLPVILAVCVFVDATPGDLEMLSLGGLLVLLYVTYVRLTSGTAGGLGSVVGAFGSTSSARAI